MEVGPLARMLVGLCRRPRRGQGAVDARSKRSAWARALFSTLGRTAARGIETQVLAERIDGWHRPARRATSGAATSIHANVEVGPATLAQGGAGLGLPRGAARRARPLGQDQGRQDRQLPVRGADHLERRARATPRARSAPTRPR